VLVVIGAHREELAFGEQATDGLDPERFAVLRIPMGISGERPRKDEMALFREQHRALYLQILDYVEPGHRLIIDVHQGVNTDGTAADVLSADHGLLERVGRMPMARRPDGAEAVRCIELVTSTAYEQVHPDLSPTALVARPVIPEAVWRNADVSYVGLEVYVETEGRCSAAEQAFARSLIEQVGECAMPTILGDNHVETPA
jgi:hypothetical protein